MILFFIFAFVTLAVNASLWWWYHQKLAPLTAEHQIKLNNADTYITELQRRCEHYRTAAVTEAIAARNRTLPVIKVYSIQRRNVTWIIENHLN